MMQLPCDTQEKAAAISKPVTRHSVIAKLEVVCRDDEANRFVEIIRAHSHSGKAGDGKIFLSSAEKAVNICAGETGDTAF